MYAEGLLFGLHTQTGLQQNNGFPKHINVKTKNT